MASTRMRVEISAKDAGATKSIAKVERGLDKTKSATAQLVQATQKLSKATEHYIRDAKLMAGAVEKLDKSLDRMTVALNKNTEALKKKKVATAAARKESKAYGDNIGFLNRSFMGFRLGVAGAAASIGFMGAAFAKASVQLAEFSDQYRAIQRGFDIGGVQLQKLRKDTEGFLSDRELMKLSNFVVQFPFPEMKQDMGKIIVATSKLAAIMGQDIPMAVENMLLALGRGSSRRLDNLGLILKQGEAEERYAKQLGKTRDALTEIEKKYSFAKIGADMLFERLENYKDITLETTQSITRVKTAWDEFKASAGEAIKPPVNNFLALLDLMLEGITKVIDAQNKMKDFESWAKYGWAKKRNIAIYEAEQEETRRAMRGEPSNPIIAQADIRQRHRGGIRRGGRFESANRAVYDAEGNYTKDGKLFTLTRGTHGRESYYVETPVPNVSDVMYQSSTAYIPPPDPSPPYRGAYSFEANQMLLSLLGASPRFRPDPIGNIGQFSRGQGLSINPPVDPTRIGAGMTVGDTPRSFEGESRRRAQFEAKRLKEDREKHEERIKAEDKAFKEWQRAEQERIDAIKKIEDQKAKARGAAEDALIGGVQRLATALGPNLATAVEGAVGVFDSVRSFMGFKDLGGATGVIGMVGAGVSGGASAFTMIRSFAQIWIDAGKRQEEAAKKLREAAEALSQGQISFIERLFGKEYQSHQRDTLSQGILAQRRGDEMTYQGGGFMKLFEETTGNKWNKVMNFFSKFSDQALQSTIGDAGAGWSGNPYGGNEDNWWRQSELLGRLRETFGPETTLQQLMEKTVELSGAFSDLTGQVEQHSKVEQTVQEVQARMRAVEGLKAAGSDPLQRRRVLGRLRSDLHMAEQLTGSGSGRVGEDDDKFVNGGANPAEERTTLAVEAQMSPLNQIIGHTAETSNRLAFLTTVARQTNVVLSMSEANQRSLFGENRNTNTWLERLHATNLIQTRHLGMILAALRGARASGEQWRSPYAEAAEKQGDDGIRSEQRKQELVSLKKMSDAYEEILKPKEPYGDAAEQQGDDGIRSEQRKQELVSLKKIGDAYTEMTDLSGEKVGTHTDEGTTPYKHPYEDAGKKQGDGAVRTEEMKFKLVQLKKIHDMYKKIGLRK